MNAYFVQANSGFICTCPVFINESFIKNCIVFTNYGRHSRWNAENVQHYGHQNWDYDVKRFLRISVKQLIPFTNELLYEICVKCKCFTKFLSKFSKLFRTPYNWSMIGSELKLYLTNLWFYILIWAILIILLIDWQENRQTDRHT